jgi:hypothetical protein
VEVTRFNRDPDSGASETLVQCDQNVRDFVAASDTLFFSCLDTLWSVATSRSPGSPMSSADASNE